MPVFDSSVLLYLLDPDARAPLDPETNAPLQDVKARIESLVETIKSNKGTIVVPTPVLSEILVHAGAAGAQYLQELDTRRWFRIEPFDQRAAVELAAMTREALSAGDLRAGTKATRAKLKFDRQIIAITRILNETVIYSDDEDIAKLAKALGIQVISILELPLPAPDSQHEMQFESDEGS